MKGLVFCGCSFTWGQGLYYYSGLETLREPPPNSYNPILVRPSHKKYGALLRFPRLVSNYFNTFEVVSLQNGGSEETSLQFLSQIFSLSNSYFHLSSDRFDFTEIEYIILQTSNPNRNPFFYEHNNVKKKYHVYDKDRQFDFYKWLKEKEISFDDWLIEHTKNWIHKVKETLQYYESKGIKIKILSWEEDYLDLIKKDEWLSDKFIQLKYNNKIYDCIRNMMNENKELHIHDDYGHFDDPPTDHHPSLKCHRVIAKNIIDNINKDLIENGINNVANECIIMDNDNSENNYGVRNYIVNRDYEIEK